MGLAPKKLNIFNQIIEISLFLSQHQILPRLIHFPLSRPLSLLSSNYLTNISQHDAPARGVHGHEGVEEIQQHARVHCRCSLRDPY